MTMGLNVTDICIFDDNHKCETVLAVRRLSASLSLFGCLFNIFIIWLFKKYTIFVQRLILYLSIAALLDSISYMMGGYDKEGAWCTFQAFSMSVWDWAVLLWICCITLNLFRNAVSMRPTAKYEWIFHAVSWTFPVVISCLPFIESEYGPAGIWCWIKHWRWRFGVWYFPLFLIIVILIVSYLYIFIMVRRKNQTYQGTYNPDIEIDRRMIQEQVKPLMAYPFVYLALSLFPLIHRILNAVQGSPVFWLAILHALSAPLQGAVNALVFGLDKETRSKLTISQMKVAFLSHSSRHQATIREYPVVAPEILPSNCEDEIEQ